MSAEKPASPTHGRDSVNDNGQGKTKNSLLQSVKSKRDQKREEVMSLSDFLEKARTDGGTYATPAQRLRKAIGEPEIIDTSTRKDELNLIFGGETVALYPAFKDFYGLEKTIDQIVSFIETAAKGGEQKRQILYFRGPVGTGKSSFTERLKQLMEKEPIYVLKCNKTGQVSPFQDSPFAVFRDHKDEVMAEYPSIPEHALTTRLSPWAVKRLQAAGNDMEAAFSVAKVYPSRENQLGIFKLEPGDKTTQDVSEVKGKFDISKIGQDDPLDPEKTLNETDPDAYMPGALGKANQGIFEFAEMFEAPKDIHLALLDATTMGECTGTKNIGLLPANCLIIAHSNDAQFQDYLKDPKSGTLMNRITKIDVPYTLRLTAERKIYEKRLAEGEYAREPIAPKTLDILAEFSIVSRMDDGRENKLKTYDKHIMARVLDGQKPDGSGKAVPKIQELYENASQEQGFHGSSTRFAFKVLTNTFNAQRHAKIIEADPILLLRTLRENVAGEKDFSQQQKDQFQVVIGKLESDYKKYIQEEIIEAYSNTSAELCQNTFETYIKKANAYLDDSTYKTATGQPVNKSTLDSQLKIMEKAAGISDSEGFRRTITRIHKDRRIEALEGNGEPLSWDAYPDMAKVIRASLYKSLKDALPVIRENSQMTDDQSLKNRSAFEKNMESKGYTRTMVARALDLFPDLT
jgi:serine protein kinase